MYFVGREKEIGQIRESLEEGRNVIISGKYGMGRTSLVQHIADTMKGQWRFVFVDFSKTPGSVCNHLLAELFPMHAFDREHLKYKPSRFRIATLAIQDNRKHAIVLDNISKLSAQKINLIRYLTWENRFQFVSIVESFLVKEGLFRLRVWMNPSTFISLHRLSELSVAQFFRQLSKEQHLGWPEKQIKNLAEVTGGYPLRMKEIALREVERKRQLQEMGVEHLIGVH
ncbi:MAG: ATP-binding protein [Syntrophaceae bacterium]|nr:ATP-binding protein [Syntrophaceae bacterium]